MYCPKYKYAQITCSPGCQSFKIVCFDLYLFDCFLHSTRCSPH
jgi:hypothetical protein